MPKNKSKTIKAWAILNGKSELYFIPFGLNVNNATVWAELRNIYGIYERKDVAEKAFEYCSKPSRGIIEVKIIIPIK